VQQCTNGDPEDLFMDKYSFDEDQYDKDAIASFDRILNIGGQSIGDGEEAFIDITLKGGQIYLLVVSDEGMGTGVYELTLQELVE